MRSRLGRNLPGYLCLLLLVCACGMAGGSSGVNTKAFQVYVDGALGFSLKIPPDWQRHRDAPAGYPTLPYSRWWLSADAAPLALLVQAASSEPSPGTAPDLLTNLQRAFPDLHFAPQEPADAGAPQPLVAAGEDQRLEGLLIQGTARSYILAALLPISASDEQINLARAILASFRPLTP
jgi:hypothetical protein